MKKNSNLQDVFNDCQSQGILVSVNPSCCSTSVYARLMGIPSPIGAICAVFSDDMQVMDEIENEGCALVSWYFNTYNDSLEKLGHIIWVM
jgi:hypothetical protein